MKKFLSIVLSLAIIGGTATTIGLNGHDVLLKTSAAEKEIVSSATEWELFDNGELNLYENIDIKDNETPWAENAKIVNVISISDKVTEIDDYTFAGTKATKVYIPLSVKKISENAFKDSNIETVYYAGSSEQWAAIAKNIKKIAVEFEHAHTDGEPVNAVEAGCKTEGYTGDIYCEECDALSKRGEKTDITHKWSEDKKVKKEATCKEPGIKANYCTECGAWDSSTEEEITKGEHVFEVKEKSDAECGKGTYIAKCSACGYEKEIATTEHEYVDEVVEPTCTEGGYTLHTCKYCTVCESEKTDETKALGHNKSEVKHKEPTCTESGLDYVECTRCKKIFSQTVIPSNHETYAEIKDPEKTEWKVVTAPTCKDEGVAELYCKDCKEVINDETGKPVTKVLKADNTAHIPNEEWTIVKDAACLTDGIRVKTCSVCGKEISRETIPATGHNYVADKDVSCTEGGIITYTCEHCGDTYQKEVKQSENHDCEITVVPPTCTEKGYTVEKCRNCTYESRYNEKAALGHTMETKVLKEATCTEAGEQADVCKVCGYEENKKEIPVKEHKWKIDDEKTQKATCDTDGLAYYFCEDCKAEKSETIAHQGHKIVDTVYKPDCENKGYTEHKCTVCGSAYKDTYVDALGHEWEEKTVNATCEDDGYKTRVCSVCGKEEVTEEGTEKAIGHDWGEPTFIWNEDEGTCTIVFFCKNNEDHVEEYNCKVTKRVVREADCEEKGIIRYIAVFEKDGKEYTETDDVDVPALGHTAVTVEGKAATCTEDGLTSGKVCSECGKVLEEQKVIKAKGHTEVIDESREATCTETGLTEGKHCSVCGEIIEKQEIIPAHGHSATVIKGKEATCKEEGLTDGERCSVCGETLKEQEVIKKAAHRFGDEKTIKEASVFKKGVKEHTCENCGTKETFDYELTFLQKLLMALDFVLDYSIKLFGIFSN